MNHKRFGRVHYIATVHCELHVACEARSVPHFAISVVGEPAVVDVD